MSTLEFEDLSTTLNANPDSDPTTDFLAREQAVLGNDAAFFSTPSDPVEINSFPDISSPTANNSLFVPPATPSNNALPDYSAFHSEFPSVEIDNSQTSYSGTNGLLPSNGHQIYQNFGEEPEAIRQWKEQQREVISKRDQESEAKRQETISIAREAIDKFYEEYNEKKARAHETNKEEEQEFLKERDDLTSGTAWERICKQVDLSNVQSKSTVRRVKDVGRFKELLLSLKKDENSPGAGGY